MVSPSFLGVAIPIVMLSNSSWNILLSMSNSTRSILVPKVLKKYADSDFSGNRINYPNQVSQPHIFTYFTTDGYTGSGTNIGGWNQDVGGWVQVDSTYFPGTAFSIATIGGTQYDMTMQWQLFQGNWWLLVIDR
jgi:hypothetical protein